MKVASFAVVALCAVGAQALKADAEQPVPDRVVDEAAPAMTVFEAYKAHYAPAPTAVAPSRDDFHERQRRGPFDALTSMSRRNEISSSFACYRGSYKSK
jgi:hypothetical protein